MSNNSKSKVNPENVCANWKFCRRPCHSVRWMAECERFEEKDQEQEAVAKGGQK